MQTVFQLLISNSMKIVSVFFAVVFGALVAHASIPLSPDGYVNDFANLLRPETKTTLDERISQFEQETTHELVVVTIESLNGDTIESYANELFREWGIGKKEANNGILFLVSKNDRAMRIEVGYGLEGAVTDIQTKQLLDDIAAPSFRNGDYDTGITGVVDGLIALSRGEYTAPVKQSEKKGSIDFFVTLVFWVICLLPWVSAILARSKSWWAGGIVGGIVGTIVYSQGYFPSLVGGGIALLLIVLGLFFDFIISRAYKEYKSGSRSTLPWWAGSTKSSWRGGSGSGRGGFGGFGGGSSGGGGSSSHW